MQTSLMQRLALAGLFATVEEGMHRATGYAQMREAASCVIDFPYALFTYKGRLAEWQTRVYSGDAMIIWTVTFSDESLGSLSAAWWGGRIKGLEWHAPGQDVDSTGISGGGIHFDEGKFERLFEALRLACAAYMRRYRFTAHKKFSDTMGDVLNS